MAKKEFTCPNCSNTVELDDARDFGFCTQCGTRIVIREPVDSTVSFSNESCRNGSGTSQLSVSGGETYSKDFYQPPAEPFYGGTPGRPITITIHYPTLPIKKGGFNYFRTWVGEQDLPVAQLGDRRFVDTYSGRTRIKIRQMPYGHSFEDYFALENGDRIIISTDGVSFSIKQER